MSKDIMRCSQSTYTGEMLERWVCSHNFWCWPSSQIFLNSDDIICNICSGHFWNMTQLNWSSPVAVFLRSFNIITTSFIFTSSLVTLSTWSYLINTSLLSFTIFLYFVCECLLNGHQSSFLIFVSFPDVSWSLFLHPVILLF